MPLGCSIESGEGLWLQPPIFGYITSAACKELSRSCLTKKKYCHLGPNPETCYRSGPLLQLARPFPVPPGDPLGHRWPPPAEVG